MERRAEFKPQMAVCTPMRFLKNEHGMEYMEPITMLWHRAMKMLMVPMGYNCGEIRIDGYEIGEARNLAIKEAIARKMKYVCFIDADTIVQQNGLQLLTYQLDNNPDYDIAGGLYTQKGVPSVPLIWKGWGEGVYWDWTLSDVLKEGIVGCGTGCMLVRVSLFERLEHTEEKPWFCTATGYMEDGETKFEWTMSDDLWFCRRAVEEAGAKILVDTNVYCQHVDWRTGRIYQLAEDALPVRRLAVKLGDIAEEWLDDKQAGNGSEVLRRLAKEVVEQEPEREKVIVEVGSFVGASAKIFAKELDGKGKLYCVDTWNGSPNDPSGMLTNWIGGRNALYDQFRKNLAPYLDRTVVTVTERSVTAAEKLKAIGVEADLVFIDADHTRTAEDIAAWLPLVRPGGIICGHDYNPGVFDGVVRDVDTAFGKTAEVEATVWIKRLPAESQEAA